MKIYQLNIKDADDAQYDTHFYFTHDTKSGSDLWQDYNHEYDSLSSTFPFEWDINDVITSLKQKGWTEVETEKVEVNY